jgi:hypothetical protein
LSDGTGNAAASIWHTNVWRFLDFHVDLLRQILEIAQRAKYEWREKAHQGHGLFLEIDKLADGQKILRPHDGSGLNKMADHCHIFNLTQIFDRVNPDVDEK